MDDLFDVMTYDDALVEADKVEPWLVEGIISSGSTLIFGQAKVGKSFLVSALVAALTSGEPFLGQPVPQDRDFSVALCWADDGDRATYARQIREVLPQESTPRVTFYTMPTMTPDRWEELYERVMSQGHSVVIIDNLTQVMEGNINSQEDVNRFFSGVRRFTRAGIPVVIIGHSSDKGGANGAPPSDKPMGSSAIRGSVRWLCFVKRSNRGNLTLSFTGNVAEPHKITVKHGTGARFEVVSTMDAERLKADSDNQRQQREARTLDENRRIAEYVTQECQGLGVNQAAKKLGTAPEFPKLSESSAKKKLQNGGPVRKILDLDPGANSWELAVA